MIPRSTRSRTAAAAPPVSRPPGTRGARSPPGRAPLPLSLSLVTLHPGQHARRSTPRAGRTGSRRVRMRGDRPRVAATVRTTCSRRDARAWPRGAQGDAPPAALGPRALPRHAASADQDQGAGHQGAAFRRPLAPVLRAARRPLRLDQVLQHQAGADDGAHPVADGAVVLDVDRRARRRRSPRRAAGRSRRRRPGGPRGRGSRGTASASGGSPRRRTARPGRSTRATSASSAAGVGDERQPAEGRARHVDAMPSPAAARRRRPGAAARRCRSTGSARPRGPASRPRGRARRRPPPPPQPPRARRRAAADLQHPAAGDVAEQVRVGLAQPLGAPEEVDVAEVGAVLGQVGGRGGVPPAAVGPRRLRGTGRTARDPPAAG